MSSTGAGNGGAGAAADVEGAPVPSDGATVDATASGVMLPVPKVFAAGMQQCLVGGAQRTDLQLEATLRSQVELEKRLAPLDEAMQQILASGEWVPQMKAYTAKVEGMHKRLAALSKELGVIRTRCAALGELAAQHGKEERVEKSE